MTFAIEHGNIAKLRVRHTHGGTTTIVQRRLAGSRPGKIGVRR